MMLSLLTETSHLVLVGLHSYNIYIKNKDANENNDDATNKKFSCGRETARSCQMINNSDEYSLRPIL